MAGTQMIIIVLFSAFTGWVISSLTLRLLFNTSSKKILGFIPELKSRLGDRAGKAFQREFETSEIIDQKIADPLLFEKMKPEIEKHVDFFLNEKLATVFPL